MKVSSAALMPAQAARLVFSYTPPHGTQPDDVLAPEAWSNVTKRLLPRTRIEVHAADNSWYQELMVLAVGHGSVTLARLHFVDLINTKRTTASPADAFMIRFNVGAEAFRIQRKSDKTVIQEGFPSKEAAEAWLSVHLKAA